MPLDNTVLRSSIVLDYLKSTLDFASGKFPLNYQATLALANGTGANQADLAFWDQRTLAPSANEDHDLAGGLTDAFGAVLTFARIKGILISASSANANNVIVGGAASNQFLTWVGGGAHTVTVRPGGFLMLAAPDAVAYAVTAATGDLFRIANSGAGTSVTYDMVIVGSSA